ncbi:phosphotransferase system mannose-type iia component [Lucifera butyrica]|uniref:Phosphotransferase system mannose-type iia component n=1 Tax=Lucifera butyrica TaxID=1351585 RepID=A0A498R9K8_9FIRM|nr:PTS fructose transporter subunit IIA [Lucifera butyrica]VBB09386.1 phosphotransferase system mannose-type iia component [Lucifera butyrica]
MKTLFIVSGHGRFATALQSSIELIAGPVQDIYFVDFTAADTEETLKEKFSRIVQANQAGSVLFITDLLGGTPFKVAAALAVGRQGREVVTGVNVGSMIEAILQRETLPVEQLAAEMVAVSRKTTQHFRPAAGRPGQTPAERGQGI